MTQLKFPNTLVLPMTTLFEDAPSDSHIVRQIKQGNTFSIAFDMSQAPHVPGGNGLVHMQPDEQSNFKAMTRVQMSNEGLSDMIGFMSIENTEAVVFGEKVRLTRVFLTGKSHGDVFIWQAGVILNDEISIAYTEQYDEFATRCLNTVTASA
jgi:hypothetical protein